MKHILCKIIYTNILYLQYYNNYYGRRVNVLKESVELCPFDDNVIPLYIKLHQSTSL